MGATVKLAGWVPQVPPKEDGETEMYRRFIVGAVEMLYEINKQGTQSPFRPGPVSLAMIYTAVKNRVVALMLRNEWKFLGWFDKAGEPHIRTKRWVDRRVNEATSQEHGAQIVAVRAGFYIPSKEAENWLRHTKNGRCQHG